MGLFDIFKRKRNTDEDDVPPKPKGPPFPVQQMFVLSLCRITEPVAFCSIFPYAYYMVLSFGITDEKAKISVYCGLITSIFTFCEFATGVFWGKMSDVVGRKPVLIMGLFGTGISMVIFGFSRNLPLALIARGVGGALNGNVGVLQTAVAEVVTVKEQQPFAFSIMPFVWCVGAIVGSTLGGALADPVRNYPNYFNEGTIWDKYPFLLPNLIAAAVTVLGMLNGILFLNETNAKLKDKRDYGREVGHWITRTARGLFGYGFASHRHKSQSFANGPTERSPLLGQTDNTANGANGKHIAGQHDSAIDDEEEGGADNVIDIPLAKTFNSQVIAQIVAYGIIAYHTIIYEQLFPVLLSMDKSDEPITNPLKFTGGYGLQTSTIGIILAVQGFYQMFFQIFLFAPIIYRLGSLRTYWFCAATFPILYVITPYTVLLPEGWMRWTGLGICLWMKVTWNTLAYPANALLLTNAAPSLLVLGTINGVAASVASFCRCIGPTLGGIIQSVGLDYGYGGLSWWCAGIVAVIGAFQCYWMKEEEGAALHLGPTETEEDLWERESIIFRRGSVAVNVSNTGEPSIMESQIMAGLTHRGSSAVQNMRRMSMASTQHRRPSFSGSIQSHATVGTVRHTIRAQRERGNSTLSHAPPGSSAGLPYQPPGSSAGLPPSRNRRDTQTSTAPR